MPTNKVIRSARTARATLTMLTTACVGVSLFAARASADDPVSLRPDGATRLRLIQIPVQLDSRAFVPGVYRQGSDGPAPHGPTCPEVIKSHTNADFSGGSFTVQAGFAETELAGASYTIPAADFPAQLVLAEMIFATSNANQQTVTAWSIHFYDGTPQTGTEIASFASDDIILPHLRIGPGTAGANAQFSIEPSDPGQVIWLNSSGTNTISFAYRIDSHHQQTGNPCLTGPPTCCNAFPTTDVGGLQQAANNWLFGVNCGSFGCPPNGGWASFSQLNQLCRPSGDWVMRLTYRSINCTTPSGACCMGDGTCQESVLQSACSGAGQTFHADLTCAQVPGGCPQPTGACCLATGCQVQTESACTSNGGVYRGNATTCTATICNGACCNLTNNFCFSTSQANCAGAGGQFQGFGAVCAGANQCPRGACCKADGSCTFGTEIDCINQNGSYQLNVQCVDANCPQPPGACCFAGPSCFDFEETFCTGFGGNWHGAGSSCATPNICESCTKGDINADTLRNGRDVSHFTRVYLNPGSATATEQCAADIAAPAGVEANDVPAFVNCLLTGACP